MAFKFEGTNTGDEELEGVEGEEEASGDVEEGGGGRELSDKEKIDLRKAERAQRNAAWDRLYEDDPEEAQRKEDEIEYICDSISREVGEALDAVSDHRYHIGMADVNRALDRLSVLEYTVREAEEIEMFDDLVKGSIEGYRKQIREAKEACEKRKAELLAKGVEDDTAGRVERKEGDKTLRQIAEDLYTGQWTPEQRAVWDSLTPLEQREVVFITSGWVMEEEAKIWDSLSQADKDSIEERLSQERKRVKEARTSGKRQMIRQEIDRLKNKLAKEAASQQSG